MLLLLSAFMVFWANGAVGMIGNEDNPINLLFIGVILIALVGAIMSRFGKDGMALVMFTAGTVQASIATIFGILGGIGADMENLLFMKRTADKLFGDDYSWSVLGAGRFQMPFATQAVMMGGNVRVGLEDNLYLDRGQLATNGQLVDRARKILENMNVSVMGPADVRAKLKLTKHS